MKGHYGCINALAFSQLNKEYLITGIYMCTCTCTLILTKLLTTLIRKCNKLSPNHF